MAALERFPPLRGAGGASPGPTPLQLWREARPGFVLERLWGFLQGTAPVLRLVRRAGSGPSRCCLVGPGPLGLSCGLQPKLWECRMGATPESVLAQAAAPLGN